MGAQDKLPEVEQHFYCILGLSHTRGARVCVILQLQR